jgi:hypothetical protein
LLQHVDALVRSMLQLHKDYMQARSRPSTAPHFVRRQKVTLATKNLFVLGQPNGKLRDRQRGSFSRGGNRETQLQIETANNSTLTPGVSRQKVTTLIYSFAYPRLLFQKVMSKSSTSPISMCFVHQIITWMTASAGGTAAAAPEGCVRKPVGIPSPRCVER